MRREASEYLRKAWNKAVDVHAFLRAIRRDIEGGDTASFAAGKTRIVEISTMCGTRRLTMARSRSSASGAPS